MVTIMKKKVIMDMNTAISMVTAMEKVMNIMAITGKAMVIATDMERVTEKATVMKGKSTHLMAVMAMRSMVIMTDE
jgi:hypothetical protein